MVETNHRLTILDDEATIITAANHPITHTLHVFFSGHGQHEHPPLSDLLLHGWLLVTHNSFAWLRISAILLYIAGLLVLAECGRILGNLRTYWAVLLFGMLWPFGYFYARITGWYCFCFLLVALLTLAYLKLLQSTTYRSWMYFTILAILLLWSNYFGIAILIVFLADFLLFRRPQSRTNIKPLLASGVLTVLSFLPLLRALLADRGSVQPASTSLAASTLKAGYVLFALLASVAVAPWFFWWSIPVSLAALLLLAFILRHKASRHFILGFSVLIIGLAFTNHLDLKRLLFLTPWMMLSIALASSQVSKIQANAVILCVLAIFAFGWIGIATGRHPATTNFYEPWQNVANATAEEARNGATIISDSTTYFFYLNYALGLQAEPAHKTYLGEPVYRKAGAKVFLNIFPENVAPSGYITAVQGVEPIEELQKFSATLSMLQQRCGLISSEESTPDPAVQFKEMLGSSIPILPYRVTVERFRCGP
jgi:hypothetical protein